MKVFQNKIQTFFPDTSEAPQGIHYIQAGYIWGGERTIKKILGMLLQ